MFSLGIRPVRCVGAVALLIIASQQAAAQISVRYEAPNTQASTVSGVSTADFNGLTAGTAYRGGDIVATGTGTGPTQTYLVPQNSNRIYPLAFDQYGGAGATGNYLAAGRGGSPDTITVSLTNATSGLAQATGYFGLWVSAIDGGNNLTFKRAGLTVATFNATDLNSLLPSTYAGNPNNRTQNPTEKYVYLNFYANNALTAFDTVEINRSGGGGFEFDNVSTLSSLIAPAGQSGTFAGTATLTGFVPVPEPAGLLAAGAGVLLLARRLRRR